MIHDVGSPERAFITAGWLSPTWQTSGGDRIFALGRTMPRSQSLYSSFSILSILLARRQFSRSMWPLDFRFRAMPFGVYLSAGALLSAGISILVNRGTG